jgi:HK97 family phage major capsid protein
MSQMRLNKLMALVPVSDELLEDAPGLESWLRAKAPAKMAAKINTAIVRGTGAGQPLGILNAGCLVTVAAEAGQLNDTVYFGNIVKIWGRVWSGSRRNGIWLINQDIEQQLYAMAFDPAATSKVPVYLGPNGLADSPYGTLMGRPVVPVEACSTLGDKGDIIFADLTQYWALTKGSDVRSDVSMHLYFDQGLTSFRFTFRVNGQPAWGSTVTPENGSATRSPFVTVAERTL